MKPRRDDDAVVDLVDVILRDGAVVQADVVVTVADVPLVGVSLRAAVAGMTTMTEYGHLTEFDEQIRSRAAERHGDADADAENTDDVSTVASENSEGTADESERTTADSTTVE